MFKDMAERRTMEMYLNKAVIIDKLIASMIEYITTLENSKLSSSVLENKLTLASNLLSKYSLSKIHGNWYDTLKEACKSIREKNIIYSWRIRTNLCLTAIDAVNYYIVQTSTNKHVPILVKFVYALSNLITNIDEDSEKGNVEDLMKLVEILHMKNALPKPQVEVEAKLKDDDELCHNTFFDDLRSRLKRKSNNVIFIGGEHGAGKSYTALQLALELDKTFDLEKQIVYSNKDFVKLCNYFHEQGLWGKVIIYDEFGGGANAYNWYDESNKLLDEYLQKFRYLRLTVIFTARDVKDAISRARKRYTHLINMTDVQQCEIYKLKTYYDIEKDKLTTQTEPYEFEDEHNKYIIKRWHVPKVDNDIAEKYEEIRDKYIGQSDLKRIEEELELLESGMTIKEIIDDFIKNYAHCEEAYTQEGDINVSFLMAAYGIGRAKANRVKMILKKQLVGV
ncbi:hypothetical protein ACO3UB_08460 (plasmid) [Methanocaldococcus sp. 16A]